MSILTLVYESMANDAGVSAIVGDRIYPLLAPENTSIPFVTYSKVTVVPENVIRGNASIERGTFIISCYASTSLSSNAIASAIKAAFSGIGYIESERDDYEPATAFYSTKLVLSILYNEA